MLSKQWIDDDLRREAGQITEILEQALHEAIAGADERVALPPVSYTHLTLPTILRV